jgi:hypothetical protein
MTQTKRLIQINLFMATFTMPGGVSVKIRAMKLSHERGEK